MFQLKMYQLNKFINVYIIANENLEMSVARMLISRKKLNILDVDDLKRHPRHDSKN